MTAKNRLGALSSFAEYAQYRNLEAGCVFRSSLERIYKKSFRRVKGRQRCAFTRQELEILFALPDTTDRIGWRDFVLLVVMYTSGARAQEICDLTVKDVALDKNGNAILTLFGKGSKPRRVKITADATELLGKYIAYRRIGDQPDKHVFSSQRNEQISVSCIEEVFAKYEKMAKAAHPDKFCGGNYTPHVMRHTTASHLVEAGVPLAVVKNVLGHASIQSTQVYVELTQQNVDMHMKEWNEKWFPKNEFKDTTPCSEFASKFLAVTDQPLFQEMNDKAPISGALSFSSNNWLSPINQAIRLTGWLGRHQPIELGVLWKTSGERHE